MSSRAMAIIPKSLRGRRAGAAQAQIDVARGAQTMSDRVHGQVLSFGDAIAARPYAADIGTAGFIDGDAAVAQRHPAFRQYRIAQTLPDSLEHHVGLEHAFLAGGREPAPDEPLTGEAHRAHAAALAEHFEGSKPVLDDNPASEGQFLL